MHAIPDDPRRVAAPCCAPGEIEPDEISDKQATQIIYETIQQNDVAYGKNAGELRDWIVDAILNDEQATAEMIRRCRDLDAVETICSKIANDWECSYG